MRVRLVFLLTGLVLAATWAGFGTSSQAAPQASGGTIRGRVHLTGKLPGNPVIRMGTDPKCNQINKGKRVVQEIVVSDINGNLANVFVRLQGAFPQTPVPREPVVIDQRGCVYAPRVAGVRVGQTVQIRNDDPLSHNVHSVGTRNKAFNVNQARAGLVHEFKPAEEEVMLLLRCDIHNWMTAYLGVVTHPYFAVSNTAGTFEVSRVPAGTYTIQTWHERYGVLSKPVTVKAGATVTLDFAYTGNER